MREPRKLSESIKENLFMLARLLRKEKCDDLRARFVADELDTIRDQMKEFDDV